MKSFTVLVIIVAVLKSVTLARETTRKFVFLFYKSVFDSIERYSKASKHISKKKTAIKSYWEVLQRAIVRFL